MIHLCAYAGTTSAAAGLQRINAVNDGFLDVNNNSFTFFKPFNLITWSGFRNETTIRRWQLQSDYYRRYGFPSLTPAITGVTANNTANLIPVIANGLTLKLPDNNEVSAFVDATTASAIFTSLGLLISDGIIPIAQGEVTTLQFTNAFTVQANQWSRGVLTPEQTIPSGRYQIVGMNYFSISQNSTLARLSIPGQVNMPGVPSVYTEVNINMNTYRYGNLGSWGEFNNNQLPVIELLGITTNNDIGLLNLDVVKIR